MTGSTDWHSDSTMAHPEDTDKKTPSTNPNTEAGVQPDAPAKARPFEDGLQVLGLGNRPLAAADVSPPSPDTGDDAARGQHATLSAALTAQRMQVQDLERALVDRIADVDDDRRRGEGMLHRAAEAQREALQAQLRRRGALTILGFVLLLVLGVAAILVQHQQIRGLQRDLAAGAPAPQSAPETTTETRDAIATLTGRVDSLSDELERISAGLEQAAQAQRQGEPSPALAAAQARIDALSTSVAELATGLQSPSATPNSAAAASPELAAASARIDALSAKVAELSAGLERLAEPQERAAAAAPQTTAQDQRIDDLSARVTVLANGLRRLVDNRDSTAAESSDRTTRLGARVERMTAQVSEMSAALQDLHRRVETRERTPQQPSEQAASQAALVTRQIAQLEAEQKRLLGQLESLRTRQSASSQATVAEKAARPADTESAAGEIDAAESTPPADATPESSDAPGSAEIFETQAGEPYALQLIGMHERTDLIDFAAEAELPEQVYVRSERLRGRPWFALIHSLYPSRDAALEAAQALAPALRALEPWIRELPAGSRLDVIRPERRPAVGPGTGQ